MDSIQHGAVEDEDESEMKGQERTDFVPVKTRSKSEKGINSIPSHDPYDDLSDKSLWYKYTHEANEGHDGTNRTKRSLKSENRSSKSTCSLFIQTDPLLWRHVYEAEKRNPENTRKEITSLIAQHVKAVNAIYMDTKFDGKYPHRRTRFEVQRIKIDDYEACEHGYRGEENKFCLPNIDVSNFLNLHSQGNHEAFCLAYVFTYRYELLFPLSPSWRCTSGSLY